MEMLELPPGMDTFLPLVRCLLGMILPSVKDQLPHLTPVPIKNRIYGIPERQLKSITISETGDYWVRAVREGCILSDTIHVNKKVGKIDLGPDVKLCLEEIL